MPVLTKKDLTLTGKMVMLFTKYKTPGYCIYAKAAGYGSLFMLRTFIDIYAIFFSAASIFGLCFHKAAELTG